MTPEQEAHARMEAPWHPILRIVLEALDVERARMAELEETLNTKVEHLPPGMMREVGGTCGADPLSYLSKHCLCRTPVRT
jgi:hypothetical protein